MAAINFRKTAIAKPELKGARARANAEAPRGLSKGHTCPAPSLPPQLEFNGPSTSSDQDLFAAAAAHPLPNAFLGLDGWQILW